MSKRREINVFSISLLDLLSGALGAVIILFIAVPKEKIKNQKEVLGKTKVKQNVGPLAEAPLKTSKLKDEIKQLKKKLISMKSANKNLIDQKKDLDNKLKEQIEREVVKNAKEKSGRDREISSINADVGFKFKGKNILFIIDVSGSMENNDKIGQVKAGLKMLITTMNPSFKIDVIKFPGSRFTNHTSLWSRFGSMTTQNKQVVYAYLNEMKPYGPTPTGPTILHALKKYPTLTDIVLLSDGFPTGLNAVKVDIHQLIRIVKYRNINDVRINTIGVGDAFLSTRRSGPAIFLERLALNNDGFFVGF